MTYLLNPRVWLALALAAVLAFTHFAAYRSGRAMVLAEWNSELTKIAEQVAQAEAAARKKEHQLIVENQEVTRAYQAEKKRRAADSRANADALGLLSAELAAAREATTDAATRSGVDDPRGAIAGECSAALVTLDGYAQELAAKTRALQDYAGLCVSR